MGYLYGNSEPFSQNYDFLSAFEVFADGAATAMRVLAEAQEIKDDAEKAKVTRERSLEQLLSFHSNALSAMAKSRPEGETTAIDEYLEKIRDHADGFVEQIKKKSEATAESEAMKTEAVAKAKRDELESALSSFLTKLVLPIEKSAFAMQLEGGWPKLTARVTSPENLEAEYLLPSARIPEWQGPRKIAEFVTGLKLPVDVKKGWFSSSVQHQLAIVDDFVIGGFAIDELDAEIRLRRRASEDDIIVLSLKREEGNDLAVWFRQPGSPKEKQEELDQTTGPILSELWDKMQQSCITALRERERIIKVTINEKDVIDDGLVVPLVRHIATLIKPTLEEVAKRSPNPGELSMKLENDSGRREEIYLKKAELSAKLEGLDPETIAILELEI